LARILDECEPLVLTLDLDCTCADLSGTTEVILLPELGGKVGQRMNETARSAKSIEMPMFAALAVSVSLSLKAMTRMARSRQSAITTHNQATKYIFGQE
jgi:hypothetical protein